MEFVAKNKILAISPVETEVPREKMPQAKLTIGYLSIIPFPYVTYDRQNVFIIQATDQGDAAAEVWQKNYNSKKFCNFGLRHR